MRFDQLLSIFRQTTNSKSRQFRLLVRVAHLVLLHGLLTVALLPLSGLRELVGRPPSRKNFD